MLSLGSHQPDLSNFSVFCSHSFLSSHVSLPPSKPLVAKASLLVCDPLWWPSWCPWSVVMQPLQPVYSHRLWNCGSKSSHGKTLIAFLHQMAQIRRSSALLLTMPNASSSCLIWVSTFLLTRKEASWERSLWQECVEGQTALGKNI